MDDKITPWIFSAGGERPILAPHSGYRSPSVDELSESELDSNSCANKNTKRKTETDMRILSAYLMSLNESREVEMIPPVELDRYLAMFFSVIKKHDGYEYEPASLRGMLCSIERYLRMRNYPNSVTRDIAFINTRNMLKERQIILRERASVVKKCKQESLTTSALQKLKRLYLAKEFGPYSPMAVVNSLCLVFVVHLKIRKAIDHKQLLWGDIALRMENGREFLCYEPLPGFEFLRPKLVTNAVLRIYSHMMKDSSWDPIDIYKLYRSKRPVQMMSPDSPFYLGVGLPTTSPISSQSWYRASAIGVNKINDLVRMIRDITGSVSHGFSEMLSLNTASNIGVNALADASDDLALREIPEYSKEDISNKTNNEDTFGAFDQRDVKKTCQADDATEKGDLQHAEVEKTDDLAKIDLIAAAEETRRKSMLINDKDVFPFGTEKVMDFKRTVLNMLNQMGEDSRQTAVQWLHNLLADADELSGGHYRRAPMPNKLQLSMVIDPSLLQPGRTVPVTALLSPVAQVEDARAYENVNPNEEVLRRDFYNPVVERSTCECQKKSETRASNNVHSETAATSDELSDAPEGDDRDGDEESSSGKDKKTVDNSKPTVENTKRHLDHTDDEINEPPIKVARSEEGHPEQGSDNTRYTCGADVPGSVADAVNMAVLRSSQAFGRERTMTELCTMYPPWSIDPRLALMLQNRLAAQSHHELLQNLYASSRHNIQKE